MAATKPFFTLNHFSEFRSSSIPGAVLVMKNVGFHPQGPPTP